MFESIDKKRYPETYPSMEKKRIKIYIFLDYSYIFHKFTRNTILLDPFWNPAPPKILERVDEAKKIWLAKVKFGQIWPPIWPVKSWFYLDISQIWPILPFGVYKYYIPPKGTISQIWPNRSNRGQIRSNFLNFIFKSHIFL